MSKFLKKLSLGDSVSFIKKISSICASLGGPLSFEFDKLVQSESFRTIVDREIYYDDSTSKDDFLYARQIKALVEKQAYLDLGYRPKEVALKKFCDAEAECRRTNDRLNYRLPSHDGVNEVLFLASRKIADILGPVPSLPDLDLFYGSGAVTSVRMTKSCMKTKLASRLECSEDLLPYVSELLQELPMLTKHHSLQSQYSLGHNDEESVDSVKVFVTCGRLNFVPKTSKSDRPIVVEPILNALLQKAFGSYIKTRLKKFGVDLFDQTRNQYLAKAGSINGQLATVDLSDASDTISLSLVLDLLPSQWFDALSKARTGRVSYDGVTIELEKFSSMGNGFTFELESLIFYALTFSCVTFLGLDTQDVSVYGDDIIVPTDAYDLLLKVLDYCGFIPNKKKSFSSGPFRESCGADWFLGSDIRPFYLKDKISPRSLFVMYNWMVRRCEMKIAAAILLFIPQDLRIFGPDGYGDGHLIGSYTLRFPRSVRRAGYEGGFFYTFILKPVSIKENLLSDWLIPCYSVYCGSTRENPVNPSVTRGSRGYKKISVYTLASSIFR
jgi:hypothetical protein